MESYYIIQEATKVLESKKYEKQLLDIQLKGKKHIQIDFKDLSQISPELADQLFEEPKNTITTITESIRLKHDKEVSVEILNLPKADKQKIWEIRTEHIGDLVSISGTIVTTNPPTPEIYSTKYSCYRCENIFSVLKKEDEEKTYPPKKCSCSNKSFYVLEEVRKNIQRIRIQEDKKVVEEGEPPPRDIIVELEGQLTRPELDGKLSLGNKIEVVGLIKAKKFKKGKTSEEKYYIQANSIKIKKVGFHNIKISCEEEKKIINMSKEDIFKSFREIIFPYHKFDNNIKDSLILSLFGSKRILINNVLKERDTINILLVGPPGCGKTQLIKNVIKLDPINMFCTATFASAVGIGVSVMKDPDLGMDVAKPGLLVMCNNGRLGIDELDKMEEEQMSKLCSAISDQELPVFKGSIRHQGFQTRTAVIGGMNPKNKIFLDRDSIESQLGVPHDFHDRFDIIFALKIKIKDEEREKIDNSILKVYGSDNGESYNKDIDLVQKYIAYSRDIDPILTKEGIEYIKLVIKKMIGAKKSGGVGSYRLTSNVARLSTGVARANLHKEITIDDINKAKDLLLSSYKSRDLCGEAGEINVEMVELEGMTTKRIVEKADFHSIFIELEEKDEKKIVDGFELNKTLQEKLNLLEHKGEKLIEDMKIAGEIFLVKRDKYKRCGR